ncbi:MAG: phytanoyl-CoA dioxygenase family protein [Pseudomonadota bacterium]
MKKSAARLGDAEVRDYRREGWCVRAGALSAHETAALRDAVERVGTSTLQRIAEKSAARTYHLDGNRFVDIGHTTVQFEHHEDSQTLRVIEPVHDLEPEIDALLDDPRIAIPMQQLLGTQELSLWTIKLNLKRPLEGSGFGWHQDAPYWMHDHDDVDNLPNVMIALDAADRGNGCLRVVRRSHLQGRLPGREDGSQLEGFYTHDRFIRDADVVDIEVGAGDLIVFHPQLIHGSRPNASNTQRRALIATYQAGVKPALKTGEVRRIARLPEDIESRQRQRA